VGIIYHTNMMQADSESILLFKVVKIPRKETLCLVSLTQAMKFCFTFKKQQHTDYENI